MTNPGDDLRLLGGEVWPDFDAVVYALAGLYDEERGWGIRGEGFVAADAAGAWFRVGDRDLALCRERAAWLDAGVGRAEVARRLRERLRVDALVVPATAEPYLTAVLVGDGGGAGPGGGSAGGGGGPGRRELPLQEWLVRERAAAPPLGVILAPARPRATAEAVAAIEAADLVLIGPSSPVMSLLPIVSVPELARALAAAPRVVAVSPTVRAVAPRTCAEAGRYRVRGLLLAARGLEHSAAGVASFWAGAIDGFVLDARDDDSVAAPTLRADLLPAGAVGRAALAAAVVEFGLALPPRGARGAVRVLPGL